MALEKRKRSMPLINIDVNTNEVGFGVFLINDSYCYAKNICIDDMDLVIDYGFKKHMKRVVEQTQKLYV